MLVFAFHGRSVEHGCTVVNVLLTLKLNPGDTRPVTKLRISPLLREWIGDIPR